jgi:fumarate hydratase, class II
LMDAVPVTLGQEFSGYHEQIKNSIRRVKSSIDSISQLALGGTAVGTGLNAEPGYAEKVISLVSKDIGIPLRQAPNLFEALAARDAVVEVSGVLKTVATSLSKIANDIRWLGSGPRCGIGEIFIPDLQPGSSIMPGKVNPVMSEMLLMVCASVIGNDVAINVGGISGNFELNVMKPMMGYTLLQSITILANGVNTFTERCINGLEANEERCTQLVEQSLALVTALNPVIGYDKAAAISKESFKTGKTIRQLVLEQKLVPQGELDILLDARRMTLPPKPE